MAEYLSWVVSVTTRDGVGRDSVFSVNVLQTTAQEYIDAADDAARAASFIGDLVTKYLATTDAAFVKTQVGIEVLNDPVSNPADTVLRGNKVLMHIRSGGRGLVQTIPARKTSAYTQEVDSLKIDISAAGALKTFITALNAVGTDRFGNPLTVQSAEIVD